MSSISSRSLSFHLTLLISRFPRPQNAFHSVFCNRVVFQLFEYRYHTTHRRYGPSSTVPDLSTEQDVITDNVLTSIFIDNITAKTDDMELSTVPSRSASRADGDRWIT